jgi:hypothetical protein
MSKITMEQWIVALNFSQTTNDLLAYVRETNDINSVIIHGYTLLHWIADCHFVRSDGYDFHYHKMKVLLQYGACPNNVSDHYLRYPLIRAMLYGRYQMIRLLLKYGANPYLTTKDGANAFDLADRDSVIRLLELYKSNNKMTT